MNERQKRLNELNRINERRKIPIIHSEKEYQDFIDKSLAERSEDTQRVNIGKTTIEARKHIEDVYGKSVSNIDIDNTGIIHTFDKKEHNLEPDDLIHAVDVINTPNTISLSEKKHQGCDVLVFKKDINGELDVLAEIHSLKDYLLIFNAMRKNKVRKRPDAALEAPRN